VTLCGDRRCPHSLPSNALAWTNIAYLIWDDVDPSLLSPEQQQAIVDWLHWGGQLIAVIGLPAASETLLMATL
jgi:hypothetical protein